MLRRQLGMSLVELVTVLALVGIVSALGATLIGSVASGQHDMAGRLTASGAADAALRRLAREVQAALPNSVRVAQNGNSLFIEFIPVLDGGRYRAAIDSTAAGPGDVLALDDATDASFDVIGQPLSFSGSAYLVIENLGNDLADAYLGNNRRASATALAGGTRLGFSATGLFPAATDSRRFFITGTPVTFACVQQADGSFHLLRYAAYGWQAAQPTDPASSPLSGAQGALMLDHVAQCGASYSVALANIGLLNASVAVNTIDGSPVVNLMHQIAVDNTP
jgi:MSHA biogenesis protein MshO